MSGKKYLDSEKVIMLLRKDLICKYPSSFSFGLWAAADEITKMDGEDVRPVVRGKWRPYSPLTDTYECDKCGYQVIDESFRTNFCPNCGAMMDES